MSDAVPRIVLGDNNIYPLRLAAGGVLLIDAGLDYRTRTNETSWDAVVARAAELGFAPSEVGAVVITHAHIDHAGLAPHWLERGARVLAGADDRAAVAAGRAANEAQREVRIDELRRHGCPESILDDLAAVRGRRGLDWQPCDLASLESAEGASFKLASGDTIEVLAAPGHTPGNVVAWNAGSGELYTGDTILPTTIPTPGLHFPDALEAGRDAERWPSLPPFLASVDTLAELPVARILPGHGEPVPDPRALFDRFTAHHERRARRIVAALDGGATTAFEVARTLFRRLPEARIGQAMTEVIGHLDVLTATGRAAVVDRDPWRYELTEAGAA
jgi:glyoxylase-like metal-dependent hydrolase (beta-lactamase superfamily II)